MREIKFRAWDWNAEKMIYFSLEDLLELQSKIETESLGITDTADNRMFETIMQYTGLKDKNGKEIYEGDIVVIWLRSEKRNSKPFEIKWERDGWKLFRLGAVVFRLGEASMDWAEVIGNIYENPELLKGQGE